MADDPIVAMLKEKGLLEEQICFLVKVLNKVRLEMKKPDWAGPESSVKSILDQTVQELD